MDPGSLGVIGRYRLIEEIGRGAMGVVYRAYDPQLAREVAVKSIGGVLGPGGSGGAEAGETAARFEREARIAARVHHPNIVAVHDAGRDGERLYLVLELVAGRSLAERLAAGERWGLPEALELAAQAADALAAAHAAGVVHRDVKPANLLIDAAGRVRVTDFGIAKALGETAELTRTGMVVGSPAYLSPEQLQGLPIDGRSDLFSLGVVLYELVLRRRPFAADSFTALVHQILAFDPLADANALAALPPELTELLRACLAKDREHRLADARRFAERARELAARLRAREAASAPTILLPAAGPGPAGRGRRLLAGAAAAAVVVAVLAALALRDEGRTEPPRVGAEPARPVAPPAAGRPLPQPESPVASPVEPPVARAVEPAVAAAPTKTRPAPPAPLREEPAAPTETAPDAPDAIATPVEPPSFSETWTTRGGVEFDVSPEEAMVWVDGVRLGPADDWDGAGGGRTLRLGEPGEHFVRIEHPGHGTLRLRVIVDPAAREEVVEIDSELEELD